MKGLNDSSKKLLFVFGAARSGTTYVNSLLDDWFGYGMGPEGHFVDGFARRLDEYGDIGEKANFQRLVNDVARCPMLEIIRSKWNPEELRFDVSPAWLMEELSEQSYAGLVYAVFRCVALGQGKPRVGNKNPSYWQCLPLLHQLFPTQAQYLEVIRDGRDVALSTMKVPWGQKNVFSCAQVWVQSLQAGRDFAQQLPAERYLRIRYEDLLNFPLETLTIIEQFVKISLSDDAREAFLKVSEENSKRQNYYKWEAEMTPRDQRIFEAVAGVLLRQNGYKTVLDDPSVGALEATYYRAEEWIRKATLTLGRWMQLPR